MLVFALSHLGITGAPSVHKRRIHSFLASESALKEEGSRPQAAIRRDKNIKTAFKNNEKNQIPFARNPLARTAVEDAQKRLEKDAMCDEEVLLSQFLPEVDHYDKWVRLDVSCNAGGGNLAQNRETCPVICSPKTHEQEKAGSVTCEDGKAVKVEQPKCTVKCDAHKFDLETFLESVIRRKHSGSMIPDSVFCPNNQNGERTCTAKCSKSLIDKGIYAGTPKFVTITCINNEEPKFESC